MYRIRGRNKITNKMVYLTYRTYGNVTNYFFREAPPPYKNINDISFIELQIKAQKELDNVVWERKPN